MLKWITQKLFTGQKCLDYLGLTTIFISLDFEVKLKIIMLYKKKKYGLP